MSVYKKIAAGLLALSMIFSLAACADTSWAAKTNDKEIKAGVYISYQMMAYYEAATKNGDGKELFDKNTKIEDKSAENWINDKALADLKRYVAVNAEFDKLGLEFTEKDQNVVKVAADGAWAENQKNFEKNGISKESYANCIANARKEGKIFDKYYGEKGIEEVKDTQLKKYFTDNNVRIKIIPIQLKDGNGNLFKSEEKAAAKKMAEQYVTDANKGTDFDDLIKKYNNFYADEVAKATGEEKQEIPEVTEEFGNEIILAKDSTQLPEKVVKDIFSKTKLDQAVIVEDNEVYFVVYKYDLLERTELFDDAKDGILHTLKDEDFEKKIDTLVGEIDFVVNKDAIERYSPLNLKFQ
ncbi:MAG: hypothetical protein RR540_05890 [Oscillospiraceae bacterium]